jgi:hypothetical protein
MLQFIEDEIVVGLGELQARLVAVAALRTGIVDGLPIGQEFNGFVNTCWRAEKSPTLLR